MGHGSHRPDVSLLKNISASPRGAGAPTPTGPRLDPEIRENPMRSIVSMLKTQA